MSYYSSGASMLGEHQLIAYHINKPIRNDPSDMVN